MRRVRLRAAVAIAALSVAAPAALAAAAPAVHSQRTAAPAAGPLGNQAIPRDPAGLLTGAQIHGVILGSPGSKPEDLKRELPRLRALGINTVTIYIYAWMDSLTSLEVRYDHALTIKDADLKDLTNAAHRAGLGVKYAPIIKIRNDQTWRGHIAPTNVARWFSYYDSMVMHYSRIARAMNVEVFSIGSELSSMHKYTDQWIRLALAANKGYLGITTYMATPAGLKGIAWFRYVDVISTSPYYSLSSKSHPSVGELVYVWQHSYLPTLKALSLKERRKILMAEIGYASVVGTTYKPALAYRSPQPPASESEQATAYEALIKATKGSESWVRGIVWWNYAEYSGVPSLDTSYSMRLKKAECVVARYWSKQSVVSLVRTGVVPAACQARTT